MLTKKSRLELLIKSFLKLSQKIKIILPIHPRTKKNLIKYNLFSKLKKQNKNFRPSAVCGIT